jgi:hypothetical protein
MVQWSNLAIEVRNFRNGQLSIAASSDLRQQLAKAKLTLDLIEIAIEERFASKLHVSRVKSVRRNPIIDEVLDYRDYKFAVLVMLHDSYTLIVHRMMYLLNQSQYTSEAEMNDPWDAYNSRMFDRICQSHEYAWKLRPMGAQYMSIPLTMAFRYAKTDVMRSWILQALNELNEHRLLSSPRFTGYSMTYLGEVYTGERPPFVVPKK